MAAGGKKSEHDRIREAYIQMATIGRYRPLAPSDGLGNVELSKEELEDTQRLNDEATQYAKNFMKTEDAGGDFHIGVSDFVTNRALVYTIEAAGLLCAGAGATATALRLLEMAIEEVKHAQHS
jgi:hypothetical protein